MGLTVVLGEGVWASRLVEGVGATWGVGGLASVGGIPAPVAAFPRPGDAAAALGGAALVAAAALVGGAGLFAAGAPGCPALLAVALGVAALVAAALDCAALLVPPALGGGVGLLAAGAPGCAALAAAAALGGGELAAVVSDGVPVPVVPVAVSPGRPVLTASFSSSSRLPTSSLN